MAGKTLLDVITRPLAKKLALHAATALVSGIITILIERGWIDPATAGSLSDAMREVLVNIVNVGFGS